MNLSNNFIRKFGNNFSENVNLSNYSWFNLGGNAEFFFKPNDKNQLIEFLIETKRNNKQTSTAANIELRINEYEKAFIRFT